jgi:hypothetical protein
MRDKVFRKSSIVAAVVVVIVMVIAAVMLSPPTARAQSAPAQPTKDKNGLGIAPGGSTVIYSAADLNFSGLSIAAGAVKTSNLISVVRARAVTVNATCDQIYDVQIVTYKADQTTEWTTNPVTTAVPASTSSQHFIATEMDAARSVGTAGSNIRLPQAQMAVRLKNTAGVGATCSAEAFVTY